MFYMNAYVHYDNTYVHYDNTSLNCSYNEKFFRKKGVQSKYKFYVP